MHVISPHSSSCNKHAQNSFLITINLNFSPPPWIRIPSQPGIILSGSSHKGIILVQIHAVSQASFGLDPVIMASFWFGSSLEGILLLWIRKQFNFCFLISQIKQMFADPLEKSNFLQFVCHFL